MKLPKDFFLDNDKLRNIVSNHLEQKRGTNKLSTSYVEGMIQEEIDNVVDEMFGRTDEGMPHEISYSDVKREYDAILGFLKGDLMKRVGSKYIADALELLSSDVRDGVFDSKIEEENEGEEEASQTGTGEQQASAKEQGMKQDVVKVAKFMFKHKQLGPALGKIKGDKIESAQLMVLLAQELGINASDLQKMQVQMKSAMTKAEK